MDIKTDLKAALRGWGGDFSVSTCNRDPLEKGPFCKSSAMIPIVILVDGKGLATRIP